MSHACLICGSGQNVEEWPLCDYCSRGGQRAGWNINKELLEALTNLAWAVDTGPHSKEYEKVIKPAVVAIHRARGLT